MEKGEIDLKVVKRDAILLEECSRRGSDLVGEANCVCRMREESHVSAIETENDEMGNIA